jgi:hypothetical protein
MFSLILESFGMKFPLSALTGLVGGVHELSRLGRVYRSTTHDAAVFAVASTVHKRDILVNSEITRKTSARFDLRFRS